MKTMLGTRLAGRAHFFQPNRRQAWAYEYGYYQCHGSIVLFLDSDDVVDHSIMREAAAVIEAGWSEVQFQMRVINESGMVSSDNFPKFRNDTTPSRIREWASTTGSYPTPPNSGNIYARDFLEKIFPLERGMDAFVDSYCLSTAPFLGKVFTIRKPLVGYRVHGKNSGAQSQLDLGKIACNLKRHFDRFAYSSRIAAAHGILVRPDCCRYGFYNLTMRIASLRLAPANHPLPGDKVLTCFRDGLTSFRRPQGMPPLLHVAIFAWFLAVAFAPKAVARKLVSWRFARVATYPGSEIPARV